jgi:hypothetical protein
MDAWEKTTTRNMQICLQPIELIAKSICPCVLMAQKYSKWVYISVQLATFLAAEPQTNQSSCMYPPK